MKKHPASVDLNNFPPVFHHLLTNTAVFDSSSSPEARVLYICAEGGLYLKSAAKGALAREAAMTSYLHSKGLAPEVCAYESLDRDWLLTRAVPGEDCTHPLYLENPQRLCDSLAVFLRQLHNLSPAGCPIPDRTETYLADAARNHAAGKWDPTFLTEHWNFSGAEECRSVMVQNRPYLKSDTLLHGDYCLPNVMMDSWKFTGFIDVGNGGVGDRHIDLFWGIWSLEFNLKTLRYTDRFLDAYGRDKTEPELLRTIAAIETFG